MEIRLFPLAYTKKPLPNEWNTKNNLLYDEWKAGSPLIWQNKHGVEQILAPKDWKALGLVCGGECPIVFDFDSDFPRLLLRDLFPEQLIQHTPSGGFHLFFQPEYDIKQNFSRLIPDLDIRGSSRDNTAAGQVVVYDMTILEKLEEAPKVPIWAFILFPALKKSKTLRKFLLELAEGQGFEARNQTFFNEFGIPLVKFGVDPGTVETLLLNANDLLPEPLSEDEIEQLIVNVLNSDAANSPIEISTSSNNPTSKAIALIEEKYRIFKDKRSGLLFMDGKPTDKEYAALKAVVHMGIKKTTALDAISYIENKNSIDTICDWLNDLPEWDKVDRVNTIMEQIVENKNLIDFYRSVFIKWAMGLFSKRDERSPGHKLFLTMIGEQNSGKSSLLFNLCPPPKNGVSFFVDNLSIEVFNSFSAKDAWAVLNQSIICEFAEMVGNRRRNQEALKNLVSGRGIKVRGAYERSIKALIPVCIFAGTTNRWTPLKDETGTARFITIRVGDCKPILDMVREERDQIWAQIQYEYDVGTPWQLSPEEVAIQNMVNAEATYIDEASRQIIEIIEGLKEKGYKLFSASALWQAVRMELEWSFIDQQRGYTYTLARESCGLLGKPIKIKDTKSRWYTFQDFQYAPNLKQWVQDNPDKVFDESKLNGGTF